MKRIINPGKEHAPLMFVNDIVYSHVNDLEGNPLDLHLSVTAAMGNSEMAALRGLKVPDENIKRHPVLIWFNGAGWRGADKDMQLPCFTFLAEAGFSVVCAYYRSSTQGHFPAQIEDVKTAIRWARANADKYSFDPNHIGVFGRSAGGQLAALAGANDGRYETEEYIGYSSEVQFVIDMFGPVDLKSRLLAYKEQEKNGQKLLGRFDHWQQTHEAVVLGGPEETILERAELYSPYWQISDKQAPMLIIHGDSDPMVDCHESELYYEKLCAVGKAEQTELVIVKNGGHGSAELWQPQVKEIMLTIAEKYLGI